MKTAAIAVLLLGAALAEAVTVQEALQNLLVACPPNTGFAECLTLGVDTIRDQIVSGITDVIDSNGNMPEQSLGGITISGSGITHSGADTIQITDTKLDGDMLTSTLKIDQLLFDGDLIADLPIVGKVKFHLNVKVKGLVAKLKLILGVKDGKLIVKDFRINVTAEEFKVVVNNGKPLTKADGSKLTGLAGSIAQSIIKGLNNKNVFLKRLLPLVVRIMKPNIIKSINERLAALPTLKN